MGAGLGGCSDVVEGLVGEGLWRGYVVFSTCVVNFVNMVVKSVQVNVEVVMVKMLQEMTLLEVSVTASG